ncbi:MAG: hypothetical protein KF773_07750 [Deltaproteobacteria bacterium]|nr:hypothetical protein [Deltaproteobacteria bacterium]MCW5805621.1 hypothetical protein [Deltaproteobacteria bacterium]
MRFSMWIVIGFLAACGGGGAPKELDQFADRACACKRDDVACGTKVLDALRTYTDSNKADVGHEVTKTGARIYDCLGGTGVIRTEVAAVLGRAIR